MTEPCLRIRSNKRGVALVFGSCGVRQWRRSLARVAYSLSVSLPLRLKMRCRLRECGTRVSHKGIFACSCTKIYILLRTRKCISQGSHFCVRFIGIFLICLRSICDWLVCVLSHSVAIEREFSWSEIPLNCITINAGIWLLRFVWHFSLFFLN